MSVVLSQRQYQMNSKQLNKIRIFSGNSNVPLAKSIAAKLRTTVAECTIDQFANTEIRVVPAVSVRKKHIYIVQTGAFTDHQSVNDFLMEVFLLCDAVYRSGAAEINVLMPCFPYARQDKKEKPRVPISASQIARLLKKCHVDKIVSVDLHTGCIQGFFDGSIDNLYCIKPIMEYLQRNMFDVSPNGKSDFVAISPDEGAIKRTTAYAKAMGLTFLAMSKTRNTDVKNTVEKTVLMGDPAVIKDKTALIFDDMIDTAGTIVKSAEYLGQHGAKEVIVIASHGFFSGPAIDRINACDIIKCVIVSDSLPQEENQKKTNKIRVFTLADMYAEVIQRLENDESISEMFA